MTLLRQISSKVRELPPSRQQKVLRFIEKIQPTGARRRTASKVRGQRKLPKAIADAFGLWKDRSDLPADPVEAARHLRVKASKRVK